MKNPINRWHEMSNAMKLGLTVALAAAAQLASTGLFLYTSAQARRENCQLIAEAFDGYTDALAKVSHADEVTVDEFRATYEPLFEGCE